ncbi:MAG: TRAP transporter small permease subunit [Thermotogae bacterium]|nr:TRAP transporter small permease subunit [Thermotogota bacterium]
MEEIIMEEKKKSFSVDEWIAAILLFVMATIAFINVVSRYLLHFSFAFTEEIGINFFVWLTVVGAGIAFERGSQLGMVTLYNIFPKKLKKTATIISALLSTFLFAIVDIILIKTIYNDMTLFHMRSRALSIPVWIYYSGVVTLSVFLFKRIYNGLVKTLKKIEENKKGGVS